MRDRVSKRIVILRSGALGDCILATPAIAAIRRHHPGAFITLVGEPNTSDLFLHSCDVDRVVSLDPKRMSRWEYAQALLNLRREGVDLLVDMHGSSRTCLQTLLIGGRRRLVIATRKLRSRVYTDPLPDRPGFHSVAHACDLLPPLGIDPKEGLGPLRMSLTPDERSAARALLEAAGHRLDRPYAVLHPTSANRPCYRRWPAERFAALADRIQRELQLPVVVTSARAGEEPVLALFSHLKSPAIDLSGKTPVRVLAALLESASLYVGLNTGPMHLSAIFGIPIAALFDKPEDPVIWYPWSAGPYKMVQAGKPAAPCYTAECPVDSESREWCIRSIGVDEVFAAAQSVLKSSLENRALWAE